jgi:N-acetylmuramic acid 6-phosphate etherase
VIGGLKHARKIGAVTVALVCNRPSAMDEFADILIAPVVGPEILSGSTRLKAGTATKLILNMITTGAMIRTGKTYGNRMVDLKPLNEKLKIRSRRILREVAGISDDLAQKLLDQTQGHLKPALVMALAGVDAVSANRLLEANQGLVHRAVSASDTVEIQKRT